MIEQCTHIHPLTRFFWWKGWSHRAAIAWLDAEGFLNLTQDEPIKLRDIPIDTVGEILMAADAAWCMPDDAERAVWFYGDEYFEIPNDQWRDSLEAGDPRKDPEAFQQWRKQQNTEYRNETPDDYDARPAYQRRK